MVTFTQVVAPDRIRCEHGFASSDTTTGASDFGNGFEGHGDVRLRFGVILRPGDFSDAEGAFDWSSCLDADCFGNA